MIEEKKLKSIAFDLDTKAVQEHYIKRNWYQIYIKTKRQYKICSLRARRGEKNRQ